LVSTLVTIGPFDIQLGRFYTKIFLPHAREGFIMRSDKNRYYAFTYGGIWPKTSGIRLLREPFADEVIYRIRRKSEHVCERRAAP